MGIIGKFGDDKHDTQPVPLINFENDLRSPNKIDSDTNPKSDEQQQSHDNKQQTSSKELSENSKEKDGTNSILVTDSVTLPNQDNNNKAMMISKKIIQISYVNTAMEKVVIAQQMHQQMNNLMSLNGKKKRNMKNINKVFAVMLVKTINQQKTISG